MLKEAANEIAAGNADTGHHKRDAERIGKWKIVDPEPGEYDYLYGTCYDNADRNISNGFQKARSFTLLH